MILDTEMGQTTARSRLLFALTGQAVILPFSCKWPDFLARCRFITKPTHTTQDPDSQTAKGSKYRKGRYPKGLWAKPPDRHAAKLPRHLAWKWHSSPCGLPPGWVGLVQLGKPEVTALRGMTKTTDASFLLPLRFAPGL